MKSYEHCKLCPRTCLINRTTQQIGICKMTSELKVARAALHFWEEPCISGTNGSGTVFFSGCNLHCVFCQNEKIAHGLAGKVISKERLSEIFLELQEQKANNINLVTPSHFVPHIIWAIEDAKRQGLSLPIVYNTSSYETIDTIKSLEGLVDIYLPDFKYFSSELAKKYSHAPDYPDVAKVVIEEMVRQQPRTLFRKEQYTQQKQEHRTDTATKQSIQVLSNPIYIEEMTEEYTIMQKGVIVRQLLLPGMLKDAKQIVKYLYETYGNQIYLSLMSQFTPLAHVEQYPELNRKVTKKEYDAYVDYAIALGVEHGFIQEEDVAKESFIPEFDGVGV